MRNFEFISGKFNVAGICTRRNRYDDNN